MKTLVAARPPGRDFPAKVPGAGGCSRKARLPVAARPDHKVVGPPTFSRFFWKIVSSAKCHACTGFAGQACERPATLAFAEFQETRGLCESRADPQLACLPRNGASMAQLFASFASLCEWGSTDSWSLRGAWGAKDAGKDWLAAAILLWRNRKGRGDAIRSVSGRVPRGSCRHIEAGRRCRA
jgi:hypothetical protein